VSSVDGAISITGTGSNGPNADLGVNVQSGAQVTSTGKGSITIKGTASAAAGSVAVNIVSGASVLSSTGTGDISRLGDTLNFDTSGGGNTISISAGPNIVTLDVVTAGQGIILGATPSGSLGLTNAELGVITAATLQIGDSTAGDITVSNAITLT